MLAVELAIALTPHWIDVGTPRLGIEWLEKVLEVHPPPAISGRRIKIRYATQPKARPPLFALFGNQLDALPDSYQRYLINSLRETFDMPGTPIRISLRGNDNPYKGKRRKWD